MTFRPLRVGGHGVPDDHVVGREPELVALTEFIATDGGQRAFVLTGEPGIGKTTLWRAGVAAAGSHGFRVIHARPSDAEAQMSFAALGDLLHDVDIAARHGVPAPQRRALEVALLRTEPDDVPAELFAVSTGFVSVLTSLAQEQPLLVAVDDVPWLDRASADLLTFAARRISGRPIRFLFARRPGKPTPLERVFDPRSLTRLELTALSLGATRSILSRTLGLSFPRRVLVRLHEAAQGNPLFALELARALAAHGTPELGAELPIPDILDDVFATRIAGLDERVRGALLGVSLSGDLSPADLASIAGARAVEEAIACGVLAIEAGRVRVSHPLIAAASRRHSTVEERSTLHRELAHVAASEIVSAAHLARAAETVDADLAQTISAAAARAIARGAAHDAVEVAGHALRLTPPDASERADRLLDLGRYLVIAGETQRARTLVEESLDAIPEGPSRGRAFFLLGECARTTGEWEHFVDRALAESEGDVELRATALATKATLLAAARFCRLEEAERLARDALDVAAAAGTELERWAACALAWVRLMRGRRFADLSERFALQPGGTSLYQNAIERVAGTQLVTRGEIGEARAVFERLRHLAEGRGEARSGMIMHFGLVEVALRAGDAEAAALLIGESDDWLLLEDAGHMQDRSLAFLALLRGLPAEAEQLAQRTIARAREIEDVREELEGVRAIGIAALLTHELQSAVDALGEIWKHAEREGIDDPGVFPVAPDLVESLAQLGELTKAVAVTQRLRMLAEQQEHPWGLASAKRCEGVIALSAGRYDEAAAATLADASESYRELGLHFDEARSLLALGRFQRRFKKWAAARRSLDRAADTFAGLGCTGWADQARDELSRVGARKPAPEGALSGTEERVAALAADGLANKEIAAELFVTVKTVEKHLSRIYAKLGVRSRAQLAHRLRSPQPSEE